MKKYVKVIVLGFVLIGVVGGYYLWCSYHPWISIKVSMAGKGQELQVEMPSVVYSEAHGIKMTSSIEHNLSDFQDKYNAVLDDVLNNYSTSNIKLDIIVKDNKTILNYHGTATTLAGNSVDYHKEIICDYVLDESLVN